MSEEALKHSDIASMMKGIGTAVRAYVTKSLAQVLERVTALEARRDELSALHTRVAKLEVERVVYSGVFAKDRARAYRRGEMVSHGGSIWHANCATKSVPGTGVHWTLAVKGTR